MSESLVIGEVIGIVEPRFEEVNPKTRKCTGRLQPFRVESVDEHGQYSLTPAHGAKIDREVRLPGAQWKGYGVWG